MSLVRQSSSARALHTRTALSWPGKRTAGCVTRNSAGARSHHCNTDFRNLIAVEDRRAARLLSQTLKRLSIDTPAAILSQARSRRTAILQEQSHESCIAYAIAAGAIHTKPQAMTAKTPRSWLLVAASKPADIADASKSGAEAIVLDLVELLTDKDKPGARAALEAAIGTARNGGAEVHAQIDPDAMAADLAACVRPGLSGVVVSRAESPRQIEQVAAALTTLERERGIAPGTVKIVAALETAPGNHAAYEIVRASPRVSGVTLGRADLVMDLRPEPSGEIHLMPYLMQRLIIVAGAAGVTPLGAWWRAPARGLLASPDSTYEAAQRGRAIGFKGAMCLRANQVDALNRAFH